MTMKRNLFTGGAIALVAATALFTLRRGVGRKPKAGWNADQWLQLLSGANGVTRTQTGQVSRPGTAAGYHVNIGALRTYQRG